MKLKTSTAVQALVAHVAIKEIDAEASDNQHANARFKLSHAEIEAIDVCACWRRRRPLTNTC